MQGQLSRSVMGMLQVALLVLLLGSGLTTALWAVSHNGFGVVQGGDLPWNLGAGDWNAAPSESVCVLGTPGVATAAAANEAIGWTGASPVAQGDGTSEFYGCAANLSFLGTTTWQRVSWSGVRVLPVAGLTLLWWLLFRIVGQVRRGRGFSPSVSRRIAVIGVAVMVGVPAIRVLRWLVGRWLVETSTASAIARPEGLDLGVEWVVIGLVILVIGYAWREAIRMRGDLEGLV